MKALLVTKSSDVNPSANYIRGTRAALNGLDIPHNRRIVPNLGTFSAATAAEISAGYDFIVVPYNNGGFNAMIDDTNITIPIILLGGDSGSGAAIYGSAPGVTGSPTAQADNWLNLSWSGERWVVAYTRTWTPGTGTVIASVSAASPLDESANTNSGNLVMWSSTTGGGSKFYASSMWGAANPVLPILLQAAINDGEVSVSGRFRKLPMVMDLDHVNGTDPASGIMADPTILDKIASYVPGGGVIWGGIHNGATTLGAIPAEVVTKLQQYSGAPFKYCWHDHVFSPAVGTSLDADGYDTNHTKTDQQVKYDADEATWNSHGLTFHTPAYYNSGSNGWDNATLELYSRDTSKMSSPGNDAPQAGYGFKAFRGLDSGSPRALTDKDELFHNQYAVNQKVRGVQLFNTWDMAFNTDMPYNSTADWRNNWRWLMQCVSFGMSLYLHDEDFIAADQAPGVSGKQHGYTQMQTFTDLGAYLKDVAVPFADPTDYIV